MLTFKKKLYNIIFYSVLVLVTGKITHDGQTSLRLGVHLPSSLKEEISHNPVAHNTNT